MTGDFLGGGGGGLNFFLEQWRVGREVPTPLELKLELRIIT